MSKKEFEGEIDAREGLSGPITVKGDFATLLNRVADPIRRVSLTRTDQVVTGDSALWAAIRNRTDAIQFQNFADFIERVFCEDGGDTGDRVCSPESENTLQHGRKGGKGHRAATLKERGEELLAGPSIYGVDAYNLLKLATQAFLLLEAGVVIKRPRGSDGQQTGDDTDIVPGEDTRIGEEIDFATLKEKLKAYLGQVNGVTKGLPYLERIVDALVASDVTQGSPFCDGLLQYRFTCPSMLELIWSYWHEEGMLVQTMNAICMRFQNKRGPSDRDPLANLEIDALRPLNNLIWGFIQDEYNRLTIPRRAYEYDHHYGLKILGKAVPELRSADSRSKFIEAFHNLLYRTAGFYRSDSDTTVIADGFPLLSALREVHLLLAEGAHNQFGDLPWTARAEMLMTQWLLGRQEMREFLRGRAMVPYQERWMGQVDTMKKLQGWTDTTITHFRNLAVFGEQVMLSIRYGDWNAVNDQDAAKTWARYWRPEIQGYIHAYLSATGIDLSDDIVDQRGAPARYVQPATALRDRLSAQNGKGSLPPASVSGVLTGGGLSFGALPAARRRALKPAREE
ncbi:MAG: hypothetical protein ACRD6N_12265 [Pyrinomonadaceae bacterium]